MRSCIELQANAIKHGMEDALLIIGPRPGEKTIRTEDVIAKIEEAGDSLATVMMPGINYMTGQVSIINDRLQIESIDFYTTFIVYLFKVFVFNE